MSGHLTPEDESKLTEAERAEERLRRHLRRTTGGLGIADFDLVLAAVGVGRDRLRTAIEAGDDLRDRVTAVLRRWQCSGCFAPDHPCGDPTCDYRRDLLDALAASSAPVVSRPEAEDRSAGRWCGRCGQHGSHHTDRHDEFTRADTSVSGA